MRATISFFRHFVGAPLWVIIWVNAIALANMAAVFFVGSDPRAIWVLAALLGSGVLMIWLFSRYGYSRIMGVGHLVFWGPLAVYLWAAKGVAPGDDFANRVMWTIFVLNSAAMIIDVVDLVRFLRGDRQPMVQL